MDAGLASIEVVTEAPGKPFLVSEAAHVLITDSDAVTEELNSALMGMHQSAAARLLCDLGAVTKSPEICSAEACVSLAAAAAGLGLANTLEQVLQVFSRCQECPSVSSGCYWHLLAAALSSGSSRVLHEVLCFLAKGNAPEAAFCSGDFHSAQRAAKSKGGQCQHSGDVSPAHDDAATCSALCRVESGKPISRSTSDESTQSSMEFHEKVTFLRHSPRNLEAEPSSGEMCLMDCWYALSLLLSSALCATEAMWRVMLQDAITKECIRGKVSGKYEGGIS